MATNTATLLFGSGHPNDGGMSLKYNVIEFSENSTPYLACEAKNNGQGVKHLWSPRDSSHFLEDSIIMAAYLFSTNDEIKSFLESQLRELFEGTSTESALRSNHPRPGDLFGNIPDSEKDKPKRYRPKVTPRSKMRTHIDLYAINKTDPEKLTRIDHFLKEVDWGKDKIILNIFDRSSLLSNIGIVREYSMDIEVTLPAFVRTKGNWGSRSLDELDKIS